MDRRTGLCRSCGARFQAGQRGAIATRCPSCRVGRSTCVTCGGPVARMVRANGSLAPAALHCSDACKPRCSVVGCGRPRRKRDMCARCYAIARKGGDPAAPAYRWAVEHRCLVCDRTPADRGWESEHRRWCSARCQRLWYRNAGQVPTGYHCEQCGRWESLVRPGKRRRSDSRLCGDCAKVTRYSLTAWEVAARDGDTCWLCREQVDLSLHFPNWWSPSVDHVSPRSCGGSDEPENLALAHWICNVRRQDRVGPELIAMFPLAGEVVVEGR